MVLRCDRPPIASLGPQTWHVAWGGTRDLFEPAEGELGCNFVIGRIFTLFTLERLERHFVVLRCYKALNGIVEPSNTAKVRVKRYFLVLLC